MNDAISVPPGAEKFVTAHRWQPSGVAGEAASPARKMIVEWFDEAAESCLHEPENPLIEDLLDQAALSVIYGDTNSGKTFVALDLAIHVASGRFWNGKNVKHGLVVYVAAEGGNRIKRRLAALKKRHAEESEEIAPRPLFALVRHAIDLRMNDANLKELLILVREAEETSGKKCVWIIVDTLSRALSGGDENSSVDMGRIVAAADRIRAETSAHLTFIHHSGKDIARGARGHSLLRAATDTEIEVTPGALTVMKQRDMENGFSIGFDLIDLPIGTDPNGRPIKSAIVRWKSRISKPEKAENSRSIPPSMRMLMDAVADAIADVGQSIRPIHDGPVVTAVSEKAIRLRFDARLAERAEPDEDPEKLIDRQRKNFRNAIKSAIDRKAIMAAPWNGDRWIWKS